MTKKQTPITLNVSEDMAKRLVDLLQSDKLREEPTQEEIEQMETMVEPSQVQFDLTLEGLGKLLRAIRQHNDLRQIDVAKKLGYTKPNFVHMVEKGKSKPPLGKVLKFASAYEADEKLTAVILRCAHPDTWNIVMTFGSTYWGKDWGTEEVELDNWIQNQLKG